MSTRGTRIGPVRLMTRPVPWRDRLGLPDMTGRRRLVAGVAVDALGSGMFVPFSLLYFTQATTVSVGQVGIGLTVAAALGVPVVPVGGRWIDRFGPRAVIIASNAVRCAAFALYPFIGELWSILLVLTIVSCADTLYWSAHSAFVLIVANSGQRARWYGLERMLRTAGFGIGGVAASALLFASGGAGLIVIVLVNAASYFVALLAVWTWRSPIGQLSRHAVTERQPGGYSDVLRDRAFVFFSAAHLMFVFAVLALPLLLPVYVVGGLHQALWLPGLLLTVNTVLAMTQSIVVRCLERRRRAKVLQSGATIWLVSFAVFALAWFHTGLTVAWLVIAVALCTVAELVTGVATGPLLAALSPEHLRGRYMSVTQLGWSVAKVVAPAGLTGAFAVRPILPWLALATGCAVILLPLRRLDRMLPAETSGVRTEPDLARNGDHQA
jgi:MFS family permease